MYVTVHNKVRRRKQKKFILESRTLYVCIFNFNEGRTIQYSGSLYTSKLNYIYPYVIKWT
jgi:hypothetical protein